MQYFKRSNLYNLVTFILVSILATACMDKLPGAVRETQHQAERALWTIKGDNGDLEAQYDAAKLNCCGKRPLRDDIRSLNLFCEAALDGHPPSQVEVGKFYSYMNEEMRGSGIVPHDDALAYTMFALAADSGDKQAPFYKEKLLRTMKISDIERSRELRKQFPDVPCKITR